MPGPSHQNGESKREYHRCCQGSTEHVDRLLTRFFAAVMRLT
ncbi:hypothetical protein OU5_P0147 (plasmid) [Pseudomonas mandelii JR-1]|uniref:Uncharacterized protein n=1 Tax=Pseudomonas mandelii JR-1 TaxID=1147786 RepID=A0A024EKD3_9PSED|nr:hypothetical protein OU5_P0147 [Pseudomonas mandelii JR-1]